jgi:hypothetical protein
MTKCPQSHAEARPSKKHFPAAKICISLPDSLCDVAAYAFRNVVVLNNVVKIFEMKQYPLSTDLCHRVGYGSSSSLIPRNPAVYVGRHWKRGLKTKILGFNRTDDGSLATAQIWIRVAADCVRRAE